MNKKEQRHFQDMKENYTTTTSPYKKELISLSRPYLFTITWHTENFWNVNLLKALRTQRVTKEKMKGYLHGSIFL